MTSTKTHEEIVTALASVIDTSRKAKPYCAATNPVGARTVEDIHAGVGVDQYRDLLPQQDKYGWMGDERLNTVIVEGMTARKERNANQRKARARATALRYAQINAVENADITPNPERLAQAWAIMRPMVPIITRIANSKAAWARRYLGAIQDDVTQAAMMKMVLVLAKGTHDLDVLMTASEQLAGEVARKGGVPGNQESKDEKKERKAEAKARKWLMGMVNNRVMGALVDLYTERHNLKWENLDVIETIMVSINGKGDDPAFAAHNASKPPSMQGSRMQTPGSIHPDVLRMAIAAAITERGLDRLTELLLTDENVRTDGAFMWTANAEAVFLATPNGEHKWEMVKYATSDHQEPEHSRAYAARQYVRQQFSFLPWLIASVVESCDAERVAWRDGRAVMASAFDPDCFAADGSRKRPGYLVPTVTFADVREAAEVLVASLACVLRDA